MLLRAYWPRLGFVLGNLMTMCYIVADIIPFEMYVRGRTTFLPGDLPGYVNDLPVAMVAYVLSWPIVAYLYFAVALLAITVGVLPGTTSPCAMAIARYVSLGVAVWACSYIQIVHMTLGAILE